MYCPVCGNKMKLNEEDFEKKDKGYIRWWTDDQNIMQKMEINEKYGYNDGDLPMPENWDIGREDCSEWWICDNKCGNMHVYHPIYGELHKPGDSFSYHFEYVK